MTKYKVIIFPATKRDFSEIIDYINGRSSFQDKKLYDEIVERVVSLAELPFLYPLLKNSVLREKDYRVLVVHSYLLFYVVIGDVVQIRRILHGKRQYEFLL